MPLDEFKKGSIIKPLIKHREMTYSDLKNHTRFWDERLSRYIKDLEEEDLIKSRMNRNDRRSRLYSLGPKSYERRDVKAEVIGSRIYLDIMVGLNPKIYHRMEVPSLKNEEEETLDSLALQLGRLALWSISKDDLERQIFLRTYRVLRDTRFGIPGYNEIIKSPWSTDLDKFKQDELENITEKKLDEIRRGLKDYERKIKKK
jgi:DNA-binding MarR family transcriptional regulator